jgi:hypothetical protein
MTKTLFLLVGTWTIGIYWLFGACDLVLLLRSQSRAVAGLPFCAQFYS